MEQGWSRGVVQPLPKGDSLWDDDDIVGGQDSKGFELSDFAAATKKFREEMKNMDLAEHVELDGKEEDNNCQPTKSPQPESPQLEARSCQI